MVVLSHSEHQPTEQNTVTIAVIQRSARMVLLLQRNPDAYENYTDEFPRAWELIGGGVEAGEEPLAAAQRELLEETGIVVLSLELIGITPFCSKGASANNWLYLALVDKELPVVVSREHVASTWKPLTDALQMRLAYKHSSILEAILARSHPLTSE